MHKLPKIMAILRARLFGNHHLSKIEQMIPLHVFLGIFGKTAMNFLLGV